MLTVVKKLKQSLTDWVPKAFGSGASDAYGEPEDEFPYVPPRTKRKYMEERWTALPPRRRAKRPAADAAATPPPPPPPPASDAPEERTIAERRRDNAASVLAAVNERVAANKVPRPSVPSAPDKVYGGDWEHLDHTADVQFHAWGADMDVALANLGMCFFDYVTELRAIDVDPDCAQAFEVTGVDMHKFVFRFLDELLYRFAADGVACRSVAVRLTERPAADGSGHFVASVTTAGEKFDLTKHPQGTEVKAITYSAMQIHENDDKAELFVIVDI
jgi:SHS2 domain-containing protein